MGLAQQQRAGHSVNEWKRMTDEEKQVALRKYHNWNKKCECGDFCLYGRTCCNSCLSDGGVLTKAAR